MARSNKPLTALESVHLGVRIKDNDTTAINELVVGSLHLVDQHLYQFDFRYLKSQKEDLYQEGCVGLIEAAKKFDIYKGLSFEAFSSYWILKYIYRFLDSHNTTISVPVYRNGINRKIKRIIDELESTGVEASASYLLIHELVSENDLTNYLNSADTLSDIIINEEGDDLYSLIEDEDSLEADAYAIQRLDRDRITTLLKPLDKKIRFIIEAYYGFHSPSQLTFQEIADEFGTKLGFHSKMRVNQLFNEGITIIKNKLENEN